jgi:phage shock protein PspC (stress-responsive transcriptional regulator)
MSTAPAAPKQLRRDKELAVLGGVCAGIAEYLGFDITLTRVAYVLISVFTAFAGVLVYLVLWLLMPAKEPGARSPS